MLRRFAEFVLKGPREACLVALLCAVFPMMGWLGVVVIALVTLRVGISQGARVWLWYSLPMVVLAVAYGNYQIIIYNVLLGAGLTFALSVVLRQTQSWSLAIESLTLVGVLAVVGTHCWVPNIHQVWSSSIHETLNGLTEAFKTYGYSDSFLQTSNSMIDGYSYFATGINSAIVATSILMNLIIARLLQAFLFNPGGLRHELYHLQVDWATTSILGLVVVGGLLHSPLALDCLPIILLPFITTGFSMIHQYANTRSKPWMWLTGFYFLLAFVLYAVVIAMTMLAIIDLIFDFRGISDGRYFIRKSS